MGVILKISSYHDHRLDHHEHGHHLDLEVEKIEAEYKSAKELYHQYYASRKVLTHEKYILENDVMFSRFHIEGESTKNNTNNEQKQMVDSNVVSNIPISGRALKDIFADILIPDEIGIIF